MNRYDLIVVSEHLRNINDGAAHYLRERYVSNGSIRTRRICIPPEEITTFNLVLAMARRVAQYSPSTAQLFLHSKGLEGTGTPMDGPSGADLQIAIELAPKAWLDLAIQAKRFYLPSRGYEKWDPIQNQKLITWARRQNPPMTPAMLLYNTESPPFPVVHGDTTDLFQGCRCSADRLLARGHRFWTGARRANPGSWSPLAVSMVLETSKFSLKSPSVDDLKTVAFPWECLFCRSNPHIRIGPTGSGPTSSGSPTSSGRPTSSGDGDPQQNDAVDGRSDSDVLEDVYYPADDMPTWAQELQQFAQSQDDGDPDDSPTPELDRLLEGRAEAGSEVVATVVVPFAA